MHALITGTTRGVGHALAAQLLDRGWSVTGVARGERPAAFAAERYNHLRLDLSDLSACEQPLKQLVAEILATEPPRFSLVNNAGSLQPMRPLVRCKAGELQRAITLGVTLPMWLSAMTLGACSRTPLRVVNLSSGAATSAYPGWGAYCTGKAALHMVDRVLAVEADEFPELAERDFAVLTYAPGVVATEMQREIRESSERDFPRRARFIELHDKQQLAQEEGPAEEIADWLEQSSNRKHEELRFTS